MKKSITGSDPGFGPYVGFGGGWWDPFWKTSGGGAWLGGHGGHKLPLAPPGPEYWPWPY